MMVPGTGVVPVIAGFGVTRLAYAVPGRVVFGERIVRGLLLKNRRVECLRYVPDAAADQFQVWRFDASMRVRTHLRAVRIVTRAAVDHGRSAVHHVGANVALGRCHASGVMATLADSFLLLEPRYNRAEHAAAGVQRMAILASNTVARVVRRIERGCSGSRKQTQRQTQDVSRAEQGTTGHRTGDPG